MELVWEFLDVVLATMIVEGTGVRLWSNVVSVGPASCWKNSRKSMQLKGKELVFERIRVAQGGCQRVAEELSFRKIPFLLAFGSLSWYAFVH
jgi:hypothetical protein